MLRRVMCVAAPCRVMRVVGRSDLRPNRVPRTAPCMAEQEGVDELIIAIGEAEKPLAEALAEARWKMTIIDRGRTMFISAWVARLVHPRRFDLAVTEAIVTGRRAGVLSLVVSEVKTLSCAFGA